MFGHRHQSSIPAITVLAVTMTALAGAGTAQAGTVSTRGSAMAPTANQHCNTILNSADDFLRDLGENPPPTAKNDILNDLGWWAINPSSSAYIVQGAKYWITQIRTYC